MKIKVINATKYIRKSLILDNVNLELCSGNIYGLQGPNGSGKTMLMRLIAGLIRPTQGDVFINEKLLGKDMGFPPSMGLMIEEPAFLPNYTGMRNLELLARIQNKATVEQIRLAIISAGLDPDDPRKYRKYSLGMKKRLSIAAAIMEQPDLILLDEPTNALDDAGIKQICKLIRRERNRGALIIIACHDGSILNQIAQEVFIVKDGIVKRRCTYEKKE